MSRNILNKKKYSTLLINCIIMKKVRKVKHLGKNVIPFKEKRVKVLCRSWSKAHYFMLCRMESARIFYQAEDRNFRLFLTFKGIWSKSIGNISSFSTRPAPAFKYIKKCLFTRHIFTVELSATGRLPKDYMSFELPGKLFKSFI